MEVTYDDLRKAQNEVIDLLLETLLREKAQRHARDRIEAEQAALTEDGQS